MTGGIGGTMAFVFCLCDQAPIPTPCEISVEFDSTKYKMKQTLNESDILKKPKIQVINKTKIMK